MDIELLLKESIGTNKEFLSLEKITKITKKSRKELSRSLRNMCDNGQARRKIIEGKAFYKIEDINGIGRNNRAREYMLNVTKIINEKVNINTSEQERAVDLLEQINNVSNSFENLFKTMGIDLEESSGEFVIKHMKIIDGKGFTIKIPRIYTFESYLDGKEIIAYENGYDDYTESPMNIQIRLKPLDATGISGDQIIASMVARFNNLGIKHTVQEINSLMAIKSIQKGMFGFKIYHTTIFNYDCYYQIRVTFNGNYDNSEEINDMIVESFKRGYR